MPLLFWFATRVGPIGAIDLYRTITVPLITAVGVGTTLFLFRYLVKINSPLLGIGVCLFIAMFSTLVVYLITPQGRSGIADFQSMLRQVIGREA